MHTYIKTPHVVTNLIHTWPGYPDFSKDYSCLSFKREERGTEKKRKRKPPCAGQLVD